MNITGTRQLWGSRGADGTQELNGTVMGGARDDRYSRTGSARLRGMASRRRIPLLLLPALAFAVGVLLRRPGRR